MDEDPDALPLAKRLEIAEDAAFYSWLMFGSSWANEKHLEYVAKAHLIKQPGAERANANRCRYDIIATLKTHVEELKTRHGAYEYEDLYWYSIPLLRELTEAAMSGYLPKQAGQVKSTKDPAEGGNLITMIADVRRAIYYKIPREDAVIILEYHAGVWLKERGYHRALVAVQEALGGRRPPGL